MVQIAIVVDESRDIGDVICHAGHDVEGEQHIQGAGALRSRWSGHEVQETMVSEIQEFPGI